MEEKAWDRTNICATSLSAKASPALDRGGYPGSGGNLTLTVAGQRRTPAKAVTGFPFAAFASGRKATSAHRLLDGASIAPKPAGVKEGCELGASHLVLHPSVRQAPGHR